MSAGAPDGWRSLGRALRHRNYRLFFAGQALSLVGTWMTRVATGWLVYRLTDSAWMLGVVGFAGQIPTFALAPFAGVMVDRWDRHRVLVATQALAMVQSALLALFTLTGTIGIPHLVALSRTHSLALSLAVIVPVGGGMMVQLAATNTLLQTLVDEAMRGRVMSLYAMALFGTVPFGSLLAGALAQRIGTADTLLAGGLACMAGALLFLRRLPELRRAVRPVYEARGILPAVDPEGGAG